MSFWLMWVVLFREGFDVVQICNPPDLLILIALPFKFLGKKIIFDQHDLSPEIYQVQKGKGQKQQVVVRVLLWFEKITYYFSDVVMVVNESCRKIAVGRGAKRDEDVFVVRNGPSIQNLRNIQPNKALRNGKRYLLSYVGMMGPQEGIDLLLRAIQSLSVVVVECGNYVDCAETAVKVAIEALRRCRRGDDERATGRRCRRL